jgi:hypothetical protein
MFFFRIFAPAMQSGSNISGPNMKMTRQERLQICMSENVLQTYCVSSDQQDTIKVELGTGIIIKSIISRTPDIDVDCSFLHESCNLESNKLM